MATMPDVERAEERLRVLTRAMHTFAQATTDLEQLFEEVARNVSEVIGDACVVLVLSDDETRLLPAAAHAVDPAALTCVAALLRAEPFLLESHAAAAQVLASRGALLVPRIDPAALPGQTTSAYATFQRELGVHSLLAVALHAHGRALGLLTLTRYRPSSPPFDEQDRELAKNLADHASLAIVNARLYVAERRARLSAEEAVRSKLDAEARFARLSEAGVIGILAARLDGTVLDVNPYVERMLGYSRDDLVSGRVRWAELTPPEFADVDIRARKQFEAEGVAQLREKELIRADGTRVPALLASARGRANDEGISFILDLTERKRIEAALERLRADRAIDVRVRAVLEAAPDAIVVTDEHGRIAMANGQTESMFGYPREALLGQPIASLFSEQTQDFERLGRRCDGSEFPLEMTESSIAVGAGKLVVRAIRDVTLRREAERELLRAKEAAETANRELETFSYSVAHDLRAPLRAMNGFARLVLQDYGPKIGEEGEGYLGQIAASATEMAALIDGLLALARLSRAPLERDTVDLSDVVHGALVRSLAAAKTSGRAQTEIVVAEGLEALADPALVRSLVDNLVDNAVKFTARVERPRIEFGELDREGERVFFVRDNGAGFEMEYAHKLFAPFQRLHTASEFSGSGIGLATTQRIVQRHGGRIWAEGVVDAGATFYFTLPDPPPSSERGSSPKL